MRIYKGGRITYTTKNLNIKGKIFQVIDKTGETINIKASQLTPEVKQKVITNKKTALKEDIMKEYGFKYKKDKPVKVPKL